MVRKTTRSSALKASEKVKKESSRKSRRRKSTSSDSSDDEILAKKTEKQSTKEALDIEDDNEAKKPLKKRTRSMATTETKRTRTRKRANNSESSQQSSQQEETEEVIEERTSKGKSKTLDKDIGNTNPETQTENVQVTDESPKVEKAVIQPNDDVSKNGMDEIAIDVNVSQSLVADMTYDIDASEEKIEGSSEVKNETGEKIMVQKTLEETCEAKEELSIRDSIAIDNEGTDKKISDEGGNKETSILKNSDNNQNQTSIHEQSQIENNKKIKLRRPTLSNISKLEDKEEVLKEESKSEIISDHLKSLVQDKGQDEEHNKRICLKRLPSKPDESEIKESNENVSVQVEKKDPEGWGSVYESNKDEESQEKTKEKPARQIILLKRRQEEANSTDTENSSVARSASVPERHERKDSLDKIMINEKKERRHSIAGEHKSSEVEDKPQKLKPTKVVKINRYIMNTTENNQASEEHSEESRGKRPWSHPSNISYVSDTAIVDFESLKEICPEVGLLESEKVDLEIKEPEKKTEKSRLKSFKELEEEEMENIEAELNAESEEKEPENKENIIAMNRKISIVDDTASKLKPPPSPARNPVSDILLITNLVRPFTVKQLKELLERTGKIRENGFWTDRIKSKCFAHYETSEEAEATRNALHGVHWPIGNGKQLIIDFSTEDEMEKEKNPPVVAAPRKEKSPEVEKNVVDSNTENEQNDSRTTTRDWDIGKEDGDKRRKSTSRTREHRERKHSRRSLTPKDLHSKRRKHEEPVPPQKAMDDLFLKTKATPSIYWQALSPEEIALKQQQRQLRLELNKRRLEEIRTSGRGGGRRDRNFRRR